MVINWPATPNKQEHSVGAASSPGMLSVGAMLEPSDHVNVPLGAKGTFTLASRVTEPSPASTYGETAMGDSIPPTPNEILSAANHTELAHTLSELQLVSAKKETVDLSNVTPSNAVVTTSDGHGTLNAPSCQGFGTAFASPSKGRRQGSVRDSNWRMPRSVSFALPSKGTDPFYEGTDTPVPHVTQEHSTIERNRAYVCDSSTVFRPREDREVAEVSGENAQALFPPNSCVFVANLVQGLADEQLEFSVTKAFEQFGKVYVKIKRDPRGMPYAFCQYEKSEDSEKAIEQGRGLLIDGRQCRTERAKVNRESGDLVSVYLLISKGSLYLTRITGGPVTEAEARNILHGRGDLEKLWIPSPTEKEMFRLGDGIWVQFAFFQDCRDAQALFKDNIKYRLEAPHHDENAGRNAPRTGPSPCAKLTPARRYVSPPFYRMRQAERCSIFMGNLPTDVTSDQLQDLLSSYGTIRSCEVISRPSPQSRSSFNVFAYVEFSNEDEAHRAANAEHHFNGTRVRVELKDTSEPLSTRSIGGMSAGSPHPRRSGITGPISREVGIARAVAAGLDTATIMHIFSADSGTQAAYATTSLATNANPSHGLIPQMQYQSYFSTPYSQYGVSAPVHSGDLSGTHVFNPTAHIQLPVSHYQYTGSMSPQYYSALQGTSSYAFQPPPTQISGTGTPPANADMAPRHD